MSAVLANLPAFLLYLALLVLPGLALLRLAGGRDLLRSADLWVHAGLAAGLGLALQPLIYLWASTLGIPAGAGLQWTLLILSTAYLIASVTRDVANERKAEPDESPLQRGLSRVQAGLRQPANLALLLLLFFLAASRLWVLRELSLPMFGDSLHHSMILRLFALQEGLPHDWRPFAELSTFSYHFGLHAAGASLAGIAEIPAPRALLVSGQALMWAQALTAYALVAGWTGRRWAGLGAALAAGGLSTMPAFYLNWGRYTQLAGQVLLPAALLATTWAAGRSLDPRRSSQWRSKDWRMAALAAILVAGMALTHYIVTLIFALAMLAWLIVGVEGGARERATALARTSIVAATAVLLASPWIPRLLAGPLDESAVKLSTGRVADPDVYGVVSPWQIWNADAIGDNLGWWLVAGMVVLGLVGLVRRERVTRVGLAWIALIFLAMYPGLLGLPITGVLKDFTVAIGAYLPAALLVGGGLGALAAGLGLESGEHRDHRATSPRPVASGSASGSARSAWLLAGLVIAAAGLRAWQDRDLLEPAFRLVHPADEAAMAWIGQNTPPDARFLVGSFSAFGDTVQAGDDAGWWLPLLAEPRTSTLPPITYGIERGFDPGYREAVNDLARLWQADLDGESTRRALAEAGVSHAYVGVTGAQLDRAALAASPYWRRIHAEGGAEVYERLDEASQAAVEVIESTVDEGGEAVEDGEPARVDPAPVLP